MTKEEAFKNWGCLNTIEWSGDQKLKDAFNEASDMHRKLCNQDPEDHDLKEYQIGHCYHEYRCKGCGFKYQIDSSD